MRALSERLSSRFLFNNNAGHTKAVFCRPSELSGSLIARRSLKTTPRLGGHEKPSLGSQLNPGISGVLVHVLSFVTFECGAETKKLPIGVIWNNWARDKPGALIALHAEQEALLTKDHFADIFLVKEARDFSMCVRCNAVRELSYVSAAWIVAACC
jgi:hypothetical protein